MPEYEFFPSLERATVSDYVDLFAECFGGDLKLSAEYINWLYVENPHGGVIGIDAYYGEQLAAHYAIAPRTYVLGDTSYSGALSINTATRPEHQGKGLFTKLASRTYDAAAARGVQFVVGAANANSVGGFTRKLGFSSLGNIRLYAGLDVPEQGDDELGLRMDASWLAWRLKNPAHRYQVREKRDGRLLISTHVRHLPFHLSEVRADRRQGLEPFANADRQIVPRPGLAPLFSTRTPRRLSLPFRLQPSPWHVIWKPLAPDLTAGLQEHLRIDGLSMDTF